MSSTCSTSKTQLLHQKLFNSMLAPIYFSLYILCECMSTCADILCACTHPGCINITTLSLVVKLFRSYSDHIQQLCLWLIVVIADIEFHVILSILAAPASIVQPRGVYRTWSSYYQYYSVLATLVLVTASHDTTLYTMILL